MYGFNCSKLEIGSIVTSFVIWLAVQEKSHFDNGLQNKLFFFNNTL